MLTPAAFGLSGLILSVFTVLGLLTDLGFQAYIVRHEHGSSESFLTPPGQSTPYAELSWPWSA